MKVASFFGLGKNAAEVRETHVDVSVSEEHLKIGRKLVGLHSSRKLGSFRCPSNEEAQRYFTTGTYRGAPGIEDKDNWGKMFQDYMGVPYTSEWETETWNYILVYPENGTADTKDPSHYVMYHWHRYTEDTPAFAGNDEHLLYASPLNGNKVLSRNPYTEWVKMDAGVGMDTVWTNRWRSESSVGGGGPMFDCPGMETSFQLVAYKGKDIRAKNYHWVLWREVMQDGIIYGSVRWIEVTDACKDDYKKCPPFDPVGEGLFGTEDDPLYASRLFVKTSDTPQVKDFMRKSSLAFEDDGFLTEIRTYTDTKIFVHEYFNRTTFVRTFKGFGYTGYNHSTTKNKVDRAAALV